MTENEKPISGIPSAEFRFFIYDEMGDGFVFYRTPEERDAGSDAVIRQYLDDGWDEGVENVYAGEVTAAATKTDITERPPEDQIDDEGMDEDGRYWAEEHDCHCNYELLPIIQAPEQQVDPVAVPDEREAFEEKFPMPSDCRRVGNTYAATEFNAWQAQAYGEIRKGWIAALEWRESSAPSAPIPPAQQPAMSDELRQHILHMRSELTKQDRSPLRARQKLAQRVTELLYASPVAQQSQWTTEGLKRFCVAFYRWWHNQPGANTEQGFDEWFEKAGKFMRAAAGRDTAAPNLNAADMGARVGNTVHIIGPEQAEQQSQTASVHDNLLDVVVSGVTEGERLEALARWLEQQHFRPDVMSIAAADLRALYRRAKEFEQDAQREREDTDTTIDLLRQSRERNTKLRKERDELRAKIEEQDAVITQRNAECSWKHHELAKLAEVIDRLVGGLEWALNEIGMEPFEHGCGESADTHRAALQAIKDARSQLGQDAIERAIITGSSLPPEAYEPPKGGDV